MKKLLVITSSMNKVSSSTLAAKKLMNKLTEKYEVKEVDLNETQFAKEMLNVNTMGTYFDDADKWIDLLKEQDAIIFATPMTNFGYTAVVKNFIDKICKAGSSFKYKYDGSGKSEGLITNPIVQIITSQGAPKGWYPFGDHTTQLEGTFKFLGMKTIKPIIITGTKTPEHNKKTMDEIADLVSAEIETAKNAL